MKNPTLKSFIESSNINARLIRAVVNQLGGWEAFQEKAPDICNHGAAGGFGGIIYYSETVAFAKKHKKLIIEQAEQLAADIGDGDAFQLIAGFNCLKDLELTPGQIAALVYGREPRDGDAADDYTQVFNALCWFAAEEVSRSSVDFLEG